MNLEASLWSTVLNPWFPRCVDPSGGFHQGFGPSWQPRADDSKSLVFQSRMTWVAATMVGEGATQFQPIARHGVRFLVDHLLDQELGALSWTTDDHQHHAYGISFAIYAFAAAARHLDDEESLQLAQQAFLWLEEHHHDNEFGGYIEAPDSMTDTDAIGTPLGCKSQNTHLHLVESFAELSRVLRDPLVLKRLREVVDILLGPLYAEPGKLHLVANRDWTPVRGGLSFGHDVEAAHLVIDAAKQLGDWPNAEILRKCQALIDFALKHGWDHRNGGIAYWGDWLGNVTDSTKNWWAGAESLLGLVTLHSETGDPAYLDHAQLQWEFLDRHQIDHEHGGWHQTVSPSGIVTGDDSKGHAWKAAYHDGRALLFASKLLPKC